MSEAHVEKEEEEEESRAVKTEPEQKEEPVEAASLSSSSCFFFFFFSLVPVYHRSIDRHFCPPATVFPQRKEKTRFISGTTINNSTTLTNTQWQPRPHADTLPHYKSREVAEGGKKKKPTHTEKKRGRKRGRDRQAGR